MNFEEFRKLLEERLGVTHLSDIARELGVSPQAVSNWKARDRIPYKYVKLIRNQQNISVENNFQHEPIQQFDSNMNGLVLDNDAFKDLSVTFIDGIYAIVKNIKLIFIVPFCLGLATLIYTQFSYIPVYKSTARLVLDTKITDGSSGGLNRIISGEETSGPSDLASTALFPQFIRTRFFAERIFEEKFYTNKFKESLPLLAILSYGKEKPTIGIDTLITRIMPILPTMIAFQLEGSFTLLTVSTFEPKLAADIANRVITELEELSHYFKNQQVFQTRVFIENRIETVGQELENLEEKLKNFRKSNRRLGQSPTLLLEQERLKRKVDIHKGMFLTLKQQLELTKIEEIQNEYLFDVLDYPIPPLGPSNSRDAPLLYAIILGVILGVLIAVILEFKIKYLSSENSKLFLEIKSIFINNLFSFFSNRNPIILLNLILFYGLIILIRHESTMPVYYGQYSLKALLIIVIYFLSFIFSIFVNINYYKLKHLVAKRLKISD